MSSSTRPSRGPAPSGISAAVLFYLLVVMAVAASVTAVLMDELKYVVLPTAACSAIVLALLINDHSSFARFGLMRRHQNRRQHFTITEELVLVVFAIASAAAGLYVYLVP